ncbi:membrane-associated proteins in eicosanoid and glutathione metabolism [Pilatotrama ljubarskyi]|nr:membrane-associated proteins in eicosanoid and glutathione metabolism [Pilatotrama ljubarskyi]
MSTGFAGIILHKEFAYPAAAAVSTFYLLAWQSFRVGRARKQAAIEYPQVYADKVEAAARKEAQVFNCTQRAHQNTLEQLPIILGSTVIGGLTYPVLAASLCGLWTFARIFYTIGYSTGDPKKRNMGGAAIVSSLSMLGLIGTSTAAVISWIRSL